MKISEKSRVWIYQANRELSTEEQNQIGRQLNHFTSGWIAHGNQLTALGEIRYNRFIILSVDEQQAGATGCSIDKSVYLMKEIEKQFNIDLFDRFQIAYLDGEVIKSCNRSQFEELLANGTITNQTIVFNNLVTSRKELETHWQISFANSWHAKVFTTTV